MGAARMLHQWTHQVRGLMPEWHGHQSAALALMAWSMCRSGECGSTVMSLVAPVKVRIASTRRRFERFLANPRLDVEGGAVMLAKALLKNFAGRRGQSRCMLLLDETAMGPWLLCMKVSVAYRGRALPLAWMCYRPGALPIPQPRIVARVLRQAASCLPPDTDVVLLADRGLSWPSVIDLCRELGWHYLLRVQGQTAVRAQNRPAQPMERLAKRSGACFLGPGEVFRSAGWRNTNLVASWPAEQSEPWLLITDLPPRLCRCSEYRRRMWQEDSFRDEKSHGFHWQRSRVRDPAHADRLLLVMLLAMWMVIARGVWLLAANLRRRIDAASRASLSIFQLGYRFWRYFDQPHYTRSPPLILTHPP